MAAQETETPAEWHCRGPGGAARQAAALRREGVTVDTGPLGELTVEVAQASASEVREG